MVTPPPARTVCAPGSTRTSLISERSITSPPSQTALPATLWPPPRTASSRPCSRAKLTELMTSATPTHRLMRAGRLSTMPFQTARVSS
jgi:hypothetical protein